jgi:hypothetical protein
LSGLPGRDDEQTIDETIVETVAGNISWHNPATDKVQDAVWASEESWFTEAVVREEDESQGLETPLENELSQVQWRYPI